MSLRCDPVRALRVARAAGAAPTASAPRGQPPVRHVFVVLLENENADVTFGPGSPAPYLSQTLPARGAFMPEYYGVTHLTLGNYVAFVSGQGSNPQTQADCQVFTDFVGGVFGPDGQALGQGCVYPASVHTVADQLSAAGLTWKGYMEDMGNDPAREAHDLRAPARSTAQDPTQTADAGRPVRGAAQPVRLLPLDHRRAGLRRATTCR